MIYFDNAATTLIKPAPVKRIYRNMIENTANPSRGGHELAQKSELLLFNSRSSIAELFGAQPQNVIFTSGATSALNLAISGSVYPQCRVLTTNLEHNSVLRPLYELEHRKDISLTIIDATVRDEEFINKCASFLKKGRAIIVLTAESNVTGKKLPLSAIGEEAHRYNSLLIVDAAQAGGKEDINIERDNIDILCLAGHKGLFGIMGAGAMLLSKNAPLPNPLMFGGSGMHSKLKGMPESCPERFEAGTLPLTAIATMGAGAQFIKDTGIEKINDRVCRMSSFLRRKLMPINGINILSDSASGAIVTFNIKGVSSDELGEYLSSKNLCVRAGFHCAPLAHQAIGTFQNGAVRASLSYFNTANDCEILVDELKKFKIN